MDVIPFVWMNCWEIFTKLFPKSLTGYGYNFEQPYQMPFYSMDIHTDKWFDWLFDMHYNLRISHSMEISKITK